MSIKKKLTIAAIVIVAVGASLVLFRIWYNTPPSFNYDNLRMKEVHGLTLAGNRINGMYVYTPPGYDDPADTTRYPVIFFFHGAAANGDGSSEDLRKILTDSWKREGYALPGAIEKGTVNPVAHYQGKEYRYIVICPQSNVYDYPTNYPGAAAVDSVIDYAIANYRVDSSRMYLTGMSTGGNMVVEYAASNFERASRVAAVSVASLCAPYDFVLQRNVGSAENIARARLPVWLMQCMQDSGKKTSCPPSIPARWANEIAAAGGLKPRLTLLSGRVPLIPMPGRKPPCLPCNGYLHNTWSTMYRQNFEGDGGPDLYNWFIQYSR